MKVWRWFLRQSRGVQVLVVGAVVVLVVAGALTDKDQDGGTGGSAEELRAWYSQNQTHMNDISDALGGLGDGGVSGISTQCELLRQAIHRAEEGLPVPDATVDGYYTEALDSYATAADLCARPDATAEGIRLATKYINEGRASMDRATAAIP